MFFHRKNNNSTKYNINEIKHSRFYLCLFQRADDQLNTKNYLAFRALSTMNENQMTLKQAKQLFGLWDNAYHESALKNCDPARRWDPAKFANMRKKKLEKVEESSEEESDGMLVRVISNSP